MKLLEHYIQSKSGDMSTCEDTFIINESFACVIDGATNVSGKVYDGKTPGQLAASTTRKAISELKGDETIQEIVDRINHHYRKLYESLEIMDKMKENPYMRPSAAMIIYSQHHRKIWMIGDCQCYFNSRLHQNLKHIDEVFSEVRSIVLKGELLAGRKVSELIEDDIGFEIIRPLIQKQYNFQNTDPDCSLSYGVINGFNIPPSLIEEIPVPGNVEQIAFASDGYPKIFETLEESEQELARLSELDPLCINEMIATKGISQGNQSFDDRTYIRFKI